MRVIVYIPASPDARKHRRDVTAQCVERDYLITHYTTDPAEARRLLDTGEVDKIAVAEPMHLTHVYPEVLVANPPRHRRTAGGAAAVLVAPLAWLVHRARRHPAIAGTAAAVGAAVAAGAALALVSGPGPDGVELADPTPVVAPTPSAGVPTVTPSPTPTGAPTLEPTNPPVGDEQPVPGANSSRPNPHTTPPAGSPGNGGGPPDGSEPSERPGRPPPAEPPAPGPPPSAGPPAGQPPGGGPPPGAGPPPGVPPVEPPPTGEPPGTPPGPEPDPEPAPGDDGDRGLLCVDLDLPPLLDADICLL